MVRARMLTLALLVMAAACSAETPEAEPVSPDDDVEVSPDTDGEPAEDDVGEDAEEPSADAGEDVSTEPGVTVGFNPRMVLYDGDGEPVEAVVMNVSARFPQNPRVGDVWDPDNPEASCSSVYVEGPDGTPTSLSVRLEDGVMAGCSQIDERFFVYSSEDCSGPPLMHVANYEGIMVNGIPMRSFGQVVAPETISLWRDDECITTANTTLYLPLAPMPSWMVNAFPNPPYEVRLEF